MPDSISKEFLFLLLLTKSKRDNKTVPETITETNIEDILYSEFGLSREISENLSKYIEKQAKDYRKRVLGLCKEYKSKWDQMLQNGFFRKSIYRPDITITSKPSSSKRGPKPKKFEDKCYSAQMLEADKILKSYPLEAILRAARLGAHRKKMVHAEYILNKLQDSETMNAEAYELRNAEDYFKTHPSKHFSIF